MRLSCSGVYNKLSVDLKMKVKCIAVYSPCLKRKIKNKEELKMQRNYDFEGISMAHGDVVKPSIFPAKLLWRKAWLRLLNKFINSNVYLTITLNSCQPNQLLIVRELLVMKLFIYCHLHCNHFLKNMNQKILSTLHNLALYKQIFQATIRLVCYLFQFFELQFDHKLIHSKSFQTIPNILIMMRACQFEPHLRYCTSLSDCIADKTSNNLFKE